MNTKNKTGFSNEHKIIITIALLKLLIHLFSNAFSNYGIFRDELYYIACSSRPAGGYVDQPPLSLYILSVSRFIFGDSLFALRLLPAIASSLLVYITGLITLKMGGGKTAVLISCISIFAAPIYWAMFTFYSMNSFDILLWALAYYVLISLIQNEDKGKDRKYWILLGLIIGLGLLNKIGFFWFGAGLFIGLLLTDKRKQLLTAPPYIAAIIALVIFSPFVIWNITHHLAHLEFIKNASSLKYSSLTPVRFFVDQWNMLNIAAPPVYLLGIYYLMFDRDGRKYRLAGYVYLITLLILIVNWHSKSEYIAPAYIILFAGGSILIEKLSRVKYFSWFKYAVTIILIVMGILSMPFAFPVLAVDNYLAYAEYMGQKPSTAENKELSELPQFYADMFGWESLAKTVSDVYKTLPENEKKHAAALAWNYGDAGSIEYFRSKYQLPGIVLCPHNNYWIWGKKYLNNVNPKPDVMIIMGGNKEDYLKIFDSVEQAGMFKNRFVMPYENNMPIFICRKSNTDLRKIWQRIRNFS
jgi:hypothetical protein